MRRANAPEMSVVDQPYSRRSGTISTPGIPIAAAVDSMTRKVRVTITQP